MLKHARTDDATAGRHSAPTLARTIQALRRISGRASRTPLETRIIAIRNEKQLV
jgi:hypothetical protein